MAKTKKQVAFANRKETVKKLLLAEEMDFCEYLKELGKDKETELDLDLALLSQLKDEFPDEWYDFAVLEGI